MSKATSLPMSDRLFLSFNTYLLLEAKKKITLVANHCAKKEALKVVRWKVAPTLSTIRMHGGIIKTPTQGIWAFVCLNTK
jgi:hypothetical protein